MELRWGDMEFAISSDVGLLRKNDEDSVIAVKINMISQMKQRELGLFIVADGMGGAKAGEIASKIAMREIAGLVIYKLLTHPSQSKKKDIIVESIKEANKHLIEMISKNPGKYDGMGTTISLALIIEDKLYWANVGDSRIYVINKVKKSIKQITKDHSVVQELLDAKKITPNEAWRHPKKNIITRVLGDESGYKVDFNLIKLFGDDIVLLCCDGLSDMLRDNVIKDIVLGSETLEDSVKNLIDEANKSGGKDNISVILVKPSETILCQKDFIKNTIRK